ncbi:MAG: immunoglobulin-like domain-containing protein, partial [Candidatus Deferrimicrobiaceae bacterium]
YTRVLSAAEIAELAEADTTPPSAPPALSATTDVLRIDLSWSVADDPESGITAYEVWRGIGGAKSLLTTVPGTQTSYPDARTTPTTTYYYEVLAVNGSGLTGPPSTEASATTAAGSGDAALVGWCKLDETTGTVAADESDYGLDGTLVNGPVWDSDGQIVGSLGFDGINDRVDLDAQILDGASDVTAALWVRTTKTGIQGLLSGANAGNDAEFELVLLSNPDLRLRFYTGETNETHVVWPIPGVADGTWHHLAVTRDATGDQAVLFVDGVFQGSRAAVFNELGVDPGGLLLGQEQDLVGGGFDPLQAFSGSLDDVRLYKRLLSDTEISDLAGLTPPDTTPPVITLVGDPFMVVEGGDPYVDAGATAVDDVDGDVSGSIVMVNPVDTSKVATYLVTYDVSDAAGNPAAQVTRTVEVVDTTPPVITLLGSSPVTVEVGSAYADPGATASDIVDGDLTSAILVVNPVDAGTVGTHVVTFDVSDASANAAVQVTRTVEVVDTGVPVITLLGSSPVTVEGGSGYTDAGATAWDDVDGDLTA